ncbi:uncharacterized protein J3R85_002954 [Psidium guajava]|nr:uncharacterized protein J3R85_002954 [Psidium guajava]
MASLSPSLTLLLFSSFFVSSFVVPSESQFQSADDAFTSILISQNGLDFVKDLLVTEAIASAVPLRLSDIQKSKKIPFVGNVKMVLSNITIYEIGVSSSYLKAGDSGVVIVASGTTCNLSMNWFYSYQNTWLVPVEISDKGRASVQVEGMEVGLTVGLENHEGTLKLSLMNSGCHVQDISIKLDGGAAWLYQGMVDAFEAQIASAVEKAITKKLKEGISKLDSLLQSLPKEVRVDDNASLNVTFVNVPELSSSSIGFEINGLFMGRQKEMLANYYYHRNPHLSVLCRDPAKMLGITLDEAVFTSASSLYYDAKFMHWTVDKVPDQSLLNTAGWRFVIPQLYKKYPNDDMDLNISLSSPPEIRITENNIDATVFADLIIDVLEAGEVIPVACISLVIRGSGSVKILQNNLAGSVKLKDFAMSLKWSTIGNLRVYLIQPVIWTVIETVFLPYVNSHLAQGFPLPIIHGFTLQNADIVCSASRITVCSDVSYAEVGNLKNLLMRFP